MGFLLYILFPFFSLSCVLLDFLRTVRMRSTSQIPDLLLPATRRCFVAGKNQAPHPLCCVWIVFVEGGVGRMARAAWFGDTGVVALRSLRALYDVQIGLLLLPRVCHVPLYVCVKARGPYGDGAHPGSFHSEGLALYKK